MPAPALRRYIIWTAKIIPHLYSVKFVFSLAAKAANANEEQILINLNNNVYIVRTNAKGQPPEGRGREKQGQKSGFPSPLTVFPAFVKGNCTSLSLTSHPFRFLKPIVLFHIPLNLELFHLLETLLIAQIGAQGSLRSHFA